MKLKHLMKYFCAFIGMLALVCNTQAANWNDGPGIGDDGDSYFSGSGALLSVIQSVRSNTLYFVSGGTRASGTPRYNSIWIKPDLTAGTLDCWVPTNSWTLASNQPAGTNIIWLTTTNLGLATNDLLCLEQVDGTVQLLVLSGNATDSAGLVYTNSAGYTAVKVFNTPTNTLTAGDTLWKLARRKTMIPLQTQNITNDVAAPWGNLWQVATRAAPYQFYGQKGKPAVVTLTFSNAADLQVEGDLKQREQ